MVELARFATSETETGLLGWAQRVSCAAVRHRGDMAARAALDDEVQVQRDRSVTWWYFDEGRQFGLEAEPPAADGAVVARALEPLSRTVPVMPGEEHVVVFAPARRADALVALATSTVASDPHPDRATVGIRAQALGVWWRRGGRTDLDNLALICSFHHRPVHEHGWRIQRDAGSGETRWFHPDGVRHLAGPSPGEVPVRGQTLAAAGLRQLTCAQHPA